MQSLDVKRNFTRENPNLVSPLIFTVLIFVTFTDGFCQELSDYSDQVARLKEAMNQLQLMAKNTCGRTTYDYIQWRNQKSEVLSTHEVSMLGVDHWKWVEKSSNASNVNTIKVVNSKYAFALTQLDQSNFAIVSVQELGRSREEDLQIERQLAVARDFPFFAYSFYGRFVWELIGHADFKINSIKTATDDSGNERFRVDFEFPPQPVKKIGIDFGIKDAFIIFEPQKNWQMIEYCRGYYYERSPQQVKDPKIAKTVSNNGSGQLAFCDLGRNILSEGIERRVIRVDSSYEPVPKEEFYLSYYGFPEPDFSRNRYWIWILGFLFAGLLCLMLSRRVRGY